MKFLTAFDHFYAAHAESTRTFLFDILPTLTKKEFESLCKKRPWLYEKYRGIANTMFGGSHD